MSNENIIDTPKAYVVWRLSGEFAFPECGSINKTCTLFLDKEFALTKCYELVKKYYKQSIGYPYDFIKRTDSIFTDNFTILDAGLETIPLNGTGNYIIPCTGFGGKGDTMIAVQEINLKNNTVLTNFNLYESQSDSDFFDNFACFAYNLGFRGKEDIKN